METKERKTTAVEGVRAQLDDRQWAKLEAILASLPRKGRPAKNNRLFVEAVLWRLRTGVPWRDLHPSFGPWKSVFNRFDRWSKNGTWMLLFRSLQTDVDSEWHSLDSTANRAHQHAAGALKRGAIRRPSAAPEAASRPKSTSSLMP